MDLEGNPTYQMGRSHEVLLMGSLARECFVTLWGKTEAGPLPWYSVPCATLHLRGPGYPSQGVPPQPILSLSNVAEICQKNTSFSFQLNYCDNPESGKIAQGFPLAASLEKNPIFPWVEILSNHERRWHVFSSREDAKERVLQGSMWGFCADRSVFWRDTVAIKLSESLTDLIFPICLIYNTVWIPLHACREARGIFFQYW